MAPRPSPSRPSILLHLLFLSLFASVAAGVVIPHNKPDLNRLRLNTDSLLINKPAPDTLEKDKLGAVASESIICSNIGIDVLRRGGNAADAMVATTFCVGVIGMYHSGIGGGGFLLVRSAAGKYESVDFRETAPAAAYEEMYRNRTEMSERGGLASGVPGDVRGMECLHERYGVLPWKELLEPAIKVARYGFPVTADLVRMMGYTSTKRDFLTSDPNWAVDFAPNGTLLGLGDTMTRERYADTLETIAELGADAFYEGKIAADMVEMVRAHNGTLTLEDFRDYKVEVREPVNIQYRGYNITSTGSPSSGTVVLAALKILEGYEDFGCKNVNLSTHRLDEAIRFAYGERTHLGDPSFVPDTTAFEKNIMLNATTARLIRSKISDGHTQNVSAYNPLGLASPSTHGTSHISTADHTGLAVTMTSTINLLFGSQVMAPSSGIIMNDEMNDFSIPGYNNAFGYVPSPANFIRPGKRPLSSITPAIVEHANGSLYFVTGAAGGSRIITSTLLSIINVLDFDMTAPEALKAPRMHDQLLPNQVGFEWTYDNATVAFMRGRGHNVTWVGPGQSSVQSIRVLGNGTFEAAGEPRQKSSGGFAV